MCHSVPFVRVFCALALSLVVFSWAGPASACTYFPVWEGFRGYPAAGASDVPTDVVLLYRNPFQGYEFHGSVSFSLEDPDGASVALNVRGVESVGLVRWTELSPVAPLRPATRYVLRAQVTYVHALDPQVPGERALEFTTGTGVWGAAPAEPEIEIAHLLVAAQPGTCGGIGDTTCLAMPADAIYQVDAPNANTLLVQGPTFISMLAESDDDPCVALRRRAPNGGLEPARTVCSAEGPLYRRDPSAMGRYECSAQGMTFEGSPIARHASAVPREQWDALLRTPTWQDAGLGDGGTDACFDDAGGAVGTEPDGTAGGGAPDTNAEEPPPDSDDSGCSVASHRLRAGDLSLWLLASVFMLPRRRGRGGRSASRGHASSPR